MLLCYSHERERACELSKHFSIATSKAAPATTQHTCRGRRSLCWSSAECMYSIDFLLLCFCFCVSAAHCVGSCAFVHSCLRICWLFGCYNEQLEGPLSDCIPQHIIALQNEDGVCVTVNKIRCFNRIPRRRMALAQAKQRSAQENILQRTTCVKCLAFSRVHKKHMLTLHRKNTTHTHKNTEIYTYRTMSRSRATAQKTTKQHRKNTRTDFVAKIKSVCFLSSM